MKSEKEHLLPLLWMLEGHNDVFCYSHTKTSSTIGFLNELPKKKTITIIDGNEEDVCLYIHIILLFYYQSTLNIRSTCRQKKEKKEDKKEEKKKKGKKRRKKKKERKKTRKWQSGRILTDTC